MNDIKLKSSIPVITQRHGIFYVIHIVPGAGIALGYGLDDQWFKF
jgi:hypothetical protein